MKRVYKAEEGYAEMLERYPYVFSIRDYTYFFTREEWNAIPVVNEPPTFNPQTQDLLISEQEENGQVVRRWIVNDIAEQDD